MSLLAVPGAGPALHLARNRRTVDNNRLAAPAGYHHNALFPVPPWRQTYSRARIWTYKGNLVEAFNAS
jgi:hypothetical protein